VLYLLHGIGGDEGEWQRFAKVDALLDNSSWPARPGLRSVMPNRARPRTTRATGDIYAAAPAFANFERDLLDDVIPAVERHYGVDARPEQRALAGLSMGGGQTFNFGLSHLGTFGLGSAASPRPRTRSRPPRSSPSRPRRKPQLGLLWVSCGNRDGLLGISQGLHAYLKEKEVPHIWHVDGNGHDPAHWRSALYWFSQQPIPLKAADGRRPTRPPRCGVSRNCSRPLADGVNALCWSGRCPGISPRWPRGCRRPKASCR
jgi:enterochelin esterase-like enzyme